MIPDFDDNGNLRPGIWQATIEEVGEHFATNEHRQKLFNAFKLVLEILSAAKCPEVWTVPQKVDA